MGDELRQAAEASADLVVARYFDSEGRLNTMPAKLSRQLAVLDLVAQRFVPGVHYTEAEVNRELMAVYSDYVSLRRAWSITADGSCRRPVLAKRRHGGGRRSDRGRATTVRISRREVIVTAAADLFARSGYAAVGMDDIGAAAGVTGPAIYRHFDSKAAVLAAVFDRIIDAVDLVDPVAATVDRSRRPAGSTMRRRGGRRPVAPIDRRVRPRRGRPAPADGGLRHSRCTTCHRSTPSGCASGSG